MRFGVLGPLAVWAADGKTVKLRGSKVRALLADLLVHRGRVVSADRLIEDLWGSRLPGRPKATLQVRASQLRSALDRAEPDGRRLLVSAPPGYRLDVRAGDLDAERFAALVSQARSTEDLRSRAAELAEALALWRGPALADFGDEPFAVATVNRLEEDRLLALEDLVETRLTLGEHHVLAGELAELVATHPFRERLRDVHMRALYAAGRQREALESYDDLRNRLRDEMGLDPGPDLVAVRQAILLQDPALGPAPAPAPLTAPAPGRSNLPVPATALVGRSDAVSEVARSVTTTRLVTLTGSGGVGKTRLALETARELAEDFPDGVWLVELSSLDAAPRAGDPVSADDVARLVSDVLGIRDDSRLAQTAWSAADRLAEALHDKRLLLVLDNCEHVIDAAAHVTLKLLHGTTQLHLMATSQESLRVDGERLWKVRPLDLPDSTETDPALLEESAAVQLFVARAAASSDFRLDRTNAAVVAAICRRLDGVPLALELAATRVRALGVDALATRLDNGFRVLANGARGAPARQQTLQAMIDWSWELLTGPERQVLSRLAVHVDGCTLEAAEAIGSGGDIKPPDVLDAVTTLVDKSLVVVVEGVNGTARYRLLESVAAYGTERLRADGELDAVRRRHRAYYVAVAEEAKPHLRRETQQDWLARLDAEVANMRSAIEGASAGGDAETALRLVNALGWYWILRGRLVDGYHLLSAALDVHGPAPTGVRARAAAWQAAFGLLLSDPDAPENRAETALDAQVPDPVQRARSEWFLGDRWGQLGPMGIVAERAEVTGDYELVRGSCTWRAAGPPARRTTRERSPWPSKGSPGPTY